jgi:predicted house-cleaning NTP pyrophosphatase (Maf/HAM1 superfamily)
MSADIDEKSIRKEKPEELVLALAEAKVTSLVICNKMVAFMVHVSFC